MIKRITRHFHIKILFVLALLQSIYLYKKIAHFQWIGIDDLLTITIIDLDVFSFIEALGSGLNLFPPLYFVLGYFLTNLCDFPKEFLLWIHIPFLWVSIWLTYLIFRNFSASQIASFATVILMTIKSAFLTQAIYVRPYCFYYVAALALLFAVIKFQNSYSTKRLILLWVSFQCLALTHYYGLPIGLLICAPLLLCNLGINAKIKYLTLILVPTIISYSVLLPKQLAYNLFKGTTPDININILIEIYKSLIIPGLVTLLIFLILGCFYYREFKFFNSPALLWPMINLSLAPIIIGFFLFITFKEGFYYRYFIPCQVGLSGIVVWIGTQLIKQPIGNKWSFILVFLSTCSISLWGVRNFDNERKLIKPSYPGSMDFNHDLILQDNIPFATSHLPTFLKLIHDPTWATRSRLLRTEEKDFHELPKYNKSLTPVSLLHLEKEKSFYYHFYYSGPHSIIDFDPFTWAPKNNFSVTKICEYPLVIKFSSKLNNKN